MKTIIVAACILSSGLAFSNNPEELGDVKWHRSLDVALEESIKDDKPILILFQEVPGCATCKNYGNNVLKHPLIVEAIESQFTPLAIYNNKKGEDSKVLQQFKEPSWNNPVVRIVDTNLCDIVPRLSSDYSRLALLETMISALIEDGSQVPEFLRLLSTEWHSQGNTKTAVYSMYCFWKGEAHFGRLDGVVSTEPGFANGKEVVKVDYNPGILSRRTLDEYAARATCKFEPNVENYRIDQTPKYYLTNSKYRMIPMTLLQQTKVNSSLEEGQDPERFLSPRQLKLLQSPDNSRSFVNQNFEEAWKKFSKK